MSDDTNIENITVVGALDVANIGSDYQISNAFSGITVWDAYQSAAEQTMQYFLKYFPRHLDRMHAALAAEGQLCVADVTALITTLDAVRVYNGEIVDLSMDADTVAKISDLRAFLETYNYVTR